MAKREQARKRADLPGAAPAGAVKAVFEIHDGPPPAAKIHGAKDLPVYLRALDLKPGQWFVWEGCTKKTGFASLSARWSAAAHRDLVVFKSAADRVVVKRPADEEGGQGDGD